MSKKLGLALGSGGARGIAHIGFLQALEENGVKPDFVTGCSMVAIVGACYCAGLSPKTIEEQAYKLRVSRIATLNVAPIHANGLFQLTKSRKLMAEIIGEKTFDELEIPFLCVATDLINGKTVHFHKGSVIDAALASSAIPGVFTPVEIDGLKYVDGGVLERVPTKPLKEMGAEVIVAIDVLGDLTVKKTSNTLIDTVLRCIDIMDTAQTKRKKTSRMRSVDLWIEPDLGAMDQYKVKKSQMLIAYRKGYEAGMENIGKIKALVK